MSRGRRAIAAAFANLSAICEEHLRAYQIEVIDLLEHPHFWREAIRFAAVPTLVLQLPEPIREIIGDLSNTDWVLVGAST